MLSGHAIKMIRSIKKISKNELKLRTIIQDLYSNCQFQYKVLNYSIDVAIPEHRIAIEYDGYYHFNSKENIDYHNIRQQKIELEGWKFLRYNIFQPFPNKEQINKDLNSLGLEI